MGLTAAASAQTRISVAQMEVQLNSIAQKKESKAAPQLAGFQLSERVTAQQLSEWQSRFTRPETREILLYLADAASIWDPPASEIPADAPPSDAEKAAMLDRARQYVRNMRPRLPNFSAMRSATFFEVCTLEQIKAEERELQFLELTNKNLGFRSLGVVSNPRELFLEGTSETIVTYQDGNEVQSPAELKEKSRRLTPRSLSTSGEFGPILALIDQDTLEGTISWRRWERGPTGLAAVYGYAVPSGSSHFTVVSPMNRLPGLTTEEHPAYHGEIDIDPATGSVLRITILADPSPSEARAGIQVPSAMIVEYGPVEIGAKTYICPVHAVAITKFSNPGNPSAPPRTFVNDVVFSGYHLFRSEMRILP